MLLFFCAPHRPTNEYIQLTRKFTGTLHTHHGLRNKLAPLLFDLSRFSSSISDLPLFCFNSLTNNNFVLLFQINRTDAHSYSYDLWAPYSSITVVLPSSFFDNATHNWWCYDTDRTTCTPHCSRMNEATARTRYTHRPSEYDDPKHSRRTMGKASHSLRRWLRRFVNTIQTQFI